MKKPQLVLQGVNSAQLLRVLSRRSYSLPSSFYSLYKILQALADSALLAYPLQVYASDKPDFLLYMPTPNSSGNALIDGAPTSIRSRPVSNRAQRREPLQDDPQVGVEHTQLVLEIQEAEGALRKSGAGPCTGYLVNTSVPGRKTPPAKTTKKKLSEDPYNLNSPGWAGDEPEMLWADAVRRTVSAKMSKIDGYQPCRKYWLIIHDTWDMSVIVKLPKAVGYLTEKLIATNIVFEEVFVICNRRMVCIRHDGLDIVDLPG